MKPGSGDRDRGETFGRATQILDQLQESLDELRRALAGMYDEEEGVSDDNPC